MPSKELFSFKTNDGVELNGWIMKPANFNPNKKYPVIIHQYSGPGSQEVADKWGIGARRDGGMFTQDIFCLANISSMSNDQIMTDSFLSFSLQSGVSGDYIHSSYLYKKKKKKPGFQKI